MRSVWSGRDRERDVTRGVTGDVTYAVARAVTRAHTCARSADMARLHAGHSQPSAPYERKTDRVRTHECAARHVGGEFRSHSKEAIMLRKAFHVAYHFVTVADEVPRHIVHTS